MLEITTCVSKGQTFSRRQRVTHPSTNRVRCGVTCVRVISRSNVKVIICVTSFDKLVVIAPPVVVGDSLS